MRLDYTHFLLLLPLVLRTDSVVRPDCNIEDSLSSNMTRKIAEKSAYPQCFLLSDSEFSGF